MNIRRRNDRPAPGHVLLPLLLFAAVCMVGVSGCGPKGGGGSEAGHQDHEAHDEHAEAPRGPHGGRLFTAPEGRLELTIHEAGVPPEFRAYLFDAAGKPQPPAGEQLTVILTRFGGRRDSIGFVVEGAYLRGTRTVDEPHSYDAAVNLTQAGRSHHWSYSQEEGRVELSPEAVKRAGIVVASAGPRAIAVTVETPGEVKLNAERVVQVRPRYAGVMKSLKYRLGDIVRTGAVLATVHSNESLTEYDVLAPVGGTVIARDAAVGQIVDHESVLFTIADLSAVWVDFAIYPQHAAAIRRGQTVRIISQSTPHRTATGTVNYVGPLLEQDTRVSYARVVLANRNHEWPPGLYVTASVTTDRVAAAIAVPEDAIVRTARGPAVFRARGSAFELQPVTPGRTDGITTEIVDGLELGALVVVRHAFILKAELGKSEASHDH